MQKDLKQLKYGKKKSLNKILAENGMPLLKYCTKEQLQKLRDEYRAKGDMKMVVVIVGEIEKLNTVP